MLRLYSIAIKQSRNIAKTLGNVQTMRKMWLEPFSNTDIILGTIVFTASIYRIYEAHLVDRSFRQNSTRVPLVGEQLSEHMEYLKEENRVIIGILKNKDDIMSCAQVFPLDRAEEILSMRPNWNEKIADATRKKRAINTDSLQTDADIMLTKREETDVRSKEGTRVYFVPNLMARKVAEGAAASQWTFAAINGFALSLLAICFRLKRIGGNEMAYVYISLSVIAMLICESGRAIFRYRHYVVSNIAYSNTTHNHLARNGVVYLCEGTWKRLLWVTLHEDKRYEYWSSNPYNGIQYTFWNKSLASVNDDLSDSIKLSGQATSVVAFATTVLAICSFLPKTSLLGIEETLRNLCIGIVASQLGAVTSINNTYASAMRTAGIATEQSKELNDKVGVYAVNYLNFLEPNGRHSSIFKLFKQEVILHFVRYICWPYRISITRLEKNKIGNIEVLVGDAYRTLAVTPERPAGNPNCHMPQNSENT